MVKDKISYMVKGKISCMVNVLQTEVSCIVRSNVKIYTMIYYGSE